MKICNTFMPTFFTALGLRFFMVMYDIFHEPLHVHITDNNKKLCKFWIFEDGKIELADNKGFSKVELQKISTTIIENEFLIKEKYEHLCKEVNARANYKKKR